MTTFLYVRMLKKVKLKLKMKTFFNVSKSNVKNENIFRWYKVELQISQLNDFQTFWIWQSLENRRYIQILEFYEFRRIEEICKFCHYFDS